MAAEERFELNQIDNGMVRLLLTEKEWLARYKFGGSNTGGSGSRSSNRGQRLKGRGGGGGHHRGADNNASGGNNAAGCDKCLYCGIKVFSRIRKACYLFH